MLRILPTIRFFAAAALVGCGLMTAAVAAANSVPSSSSSASSGVGTISVTQKNGSGSETVGKWTIIMPDNSQQTGASASQTFTATPTGSYTVFFTPPTGATATTRIYRNGHLETLVQRPQESFVLNADDSIEIDAHYTFTQIGLVAVESDPPGLTFRITGPNGIDMQGTTPASYDHMPAGQYQVKYDSLQGCSVPPAKGLDLMANNRISFAITLSCPMADTLRARIAQNESQTQNDHIAVTTGMGSSVVLRDVPASAWYASYVAKVSSLGILTGYTDGSGNLTGKFGPDDSVTLAQLAKIAHKAAGITADQFKNVGPQNPSAQNQWSAPYIASAESRGWLIYANGTVDVNRPATRGEVVTTLLQAFNIPRQWEKGNMFTDVTLKTPYDSSIETAASDGIISGYTDDNGKPTHQFGPFDPINRAEMSKVISQMLDTYRNRSSSSSSSL